jgi:hypothetical protein
MREREQTAPPAEGLRGSGRCRDVARAVTLVSRARIVVPERLPERLKSARKRRRKWPLTCDFLLTPT